MHPRPGYPVARLAHCGRYAVSYAGPRPRTGAERVRSARDLPARTWTGRAFPSGRAYPEPIAGYVPPLRDIRFVLEQLVDLDGLSKLEAFGHADPETVFGVIEESGRFMADVVGPLNRVGDTAGSTLDGDGQVTTPPGFREAYRQYVDAGWGAVPFPPEFGGGGFPWLVTVVMQEMMTSASMGFSLCPLLTQGAIEMLTQHGSPGQQATFLDKMVSGEWTGTMNLTEPQAGSDLGLVRAKAVPADDGTWRITGQKIFITFGEHNLAGNIIHLVLARVPGAPGHEGHLVLHRAQVPRPCGRVAGCPQRPAVRVDRAQARDSRQPDVRHVVRRCRRGDRVPDRRGQSGHALHVHDDEHGPAFCRHGRPVYSRTCLPGRPALRPGAQAGPGRRRSRR